VFDWPARLSTRLIGRATVESNKGGNVKSFAFYGRVSSDDAQDPSLSIPRQLSACERAGCSDPSD
jgi:hypothetical protein